MTGERDAEAPMLTAEVVELASAGDRRFDGYVVRPAGVPAPGLLVLPEMFGINEPLREMAASYASKGYTVVVPNVFWRCDLPGALAYEGDEREGAWMRLRGFDFEAAGRDLKTASDWLRASPLCTGKVGAIGFCMGGRLAMIAATRAKVDVAISLYALGLTHHLDEADDVNCPVQLHYGLADRHVPLSEIEMVQAATAGHPSIQVYTYPGAGHSFFNPVRPTYDPAAAALAAQRIDAALAELA
jgi:carboxymethylenebutenolidase